MLAETNALLTIDELGYRCKLWVEPSKKLRIGVASTGEFESSVKNALSRIVPLIETYNAAAKSFRIEFEQTEYLKAENWEALADGKSAGLPIFLGMLSTVFQIPLKPNICATGCLEYSGAVSHVGGLGQKLFDEFGACSHDDLDVILLPPGPQGETGEGQSAARRYEGYLNQLRAEHPDKHPIVIQHLEDVFDPDIAPLVFQEEAILRFVQKHGYLSQPQNISEKTGERLIEAFSRLLLHYQEHFWVRADACVRAGGDLFDLRTREGTFEAIDILGSLFEARSTHSIQSFLHLLSLRFGADLVSEILGSQLKAFFIANYANRLPEISKQCGENLQTTLRLSKREKFEPQEFQDMAAREYGPVTALLAGSVAILQSLLQVNAVIGLELYQSVGLFKDIESAFTTAMKRNQAESADANDIATMVMCQKAAKGLADLHRYYFGIVHAEQRPNGKVVLRLKPPKPCMNIEVSEDLASLEFKIDSMRASKELTRLTTSSKHVSRLKASLPPQGNDVIHNPVLLWQESRRGALPDFNVSAEHNNDHCAILQLPDGHIEFENNSKARRETGLIQAMFANGPLRIQYGKGPEATRVHWANHYQWPPSIDSLWFASVLQDRALEPLTSIADIGCGTGFLGIHLARRRPSVRTLFLTDVDAKPSLLAEFNAKEELADRENLRIEVMVGGGFSPLVDHIDETGRRLDLVVSAPPYLPKVREFGIFDGMSAAVADTELLQDLIQDGARHTHQLYLQFSQMAMPEFKEAVDKCGVKPELLATREVPVRIPQIMPLHPKLDLKIDSQKKPQRFENAMARYKQLREYNDFLLDEGRMREDPKLNFRFWHDLYVYVIEF